MVERCLRLILFIFQLLTTPTFSNARTALNSGDTFETEKLTLKNNGQTMDFYNFFFFFFLTFML